MNTKKGKKTLQVGRAGRLSAAKGNWTTLMNTPSFQHRTIRSTASAYRTSAASNAAHFAPGVDFGVHLPKAVIRFLATLGLILGMGATASGATYYWESSPSTSAWSNAANWSLYSNSGTSGAAASSATTADTLVFGVSTPTTLNNDIVGLTVKALNFGSSASAMTLSGNTISVAQGISTQSTTAETISAGINLIGNNTWTLFSGGALTESGVVSGTGSLTEAGNGTLTLSGANTYSGGTILNNGTMNLTGSLKASSALTLGDGTLVYAPTTANSTQTFSGTTLAGGMGTVTNATAGNTVALGTLTRAASGGQLNISSTVGTTTASTTLANGIIGPWATVGTGSNLRYAAGGVSGAAVTAYTGATAATTNLGNVSSGTTNYTFSAAVSQILGAVSANTLTYTGAGTTWSSALTSTSLNGLLNAGTGTLTLSFNTLGALNIGANGGTTSELVITTNNQTLVLNTQINNNNIGNTGSLTLGSVGGGTIVLGNSNNYTGTTTINSGTVQLGNANSLSSGVVTLNGATLQAATSAAYTLSNNVVVADGTSAISSNTASTVTLTGTFSGSGTLTTEALGTAGATVVFNNSSATGFTGTLEFNPSQNENWRFGTGSTSASTLDLSNANLVIDGNSATRNLGFTTGSANQTLKVGSLSGGGSNTTFIGTVAGANTLSVGALGIDSVFGGVIGVTAGGLDNIAFTKVGSGTQTLTGTNAYTGVTSVSAGTLQIGDGTSGSIALTASASISSGATLAFDMANGSVFSKTISNSGTVAGVENAGITNTLSGVISGTGTFVQTGAGTTILTGADTYTGATSVSAGTLQVGNGTTGSIGSTASASVASNAVLAFNMATGSTFAKAISNSGTVTGTEGSGTTNTLSGVISGTGAFVQGGAGTTVLSGANTYTGGNTIASGKVVVGSATGLGASGKALTIGAGATLDLNGNSYTAGSLLETGTGTTVMNGAASTAATLTVASTTLNPSGAGTVGIMTVGGLGDTAVTTLALTGDALTFDLTSPSSNDKIVLNAKGAITINTSTLSLAGTIGAGTYTLITAANNPGGISFGTGLGTDLTLSAATLSTLNSLNLSATLGLVADGSGYDVSLIVAAAVPEPSSYVLMGLGLLWFVVFRRRQLASRVE